MSCYRGHQQEKGVRDPDIEGQTRNKAEDKMSSVLKKIKEKYLRLLKWTLNNIPQIWNTIFLVSCVFSVAVDPLFFYLPVIEEERKCVALDKRLYITSICLRTVLDSISLVNIILAPYIDKNARLPGQDHHGVYITDIFFDWYPVSRTNVPINAEDAQTWSKAKIRYLWSLAIDVLAILPIPQVLVPIIISEMRGSNPMNTRKMLNAVVLSQYVPRITRIYLSWRKVLNKNTALVQSGERAMVVEAIFNLFLYIVASHVLGALWYFFSIQRETACWHLVCENYIGCHRSSLNCDHSSGNYTFLNDYCPVEKENPTLFDFGIFLEALQSDTVASMNFPRKFLYCFWWGLRNLSSLGQNLQTSPYVWENFFTTLISLFGLLLLLYFIGNLQMLMQWKTQKRLKAYMGEDDKVKMNRKLRSLELWKSKTNDLPDHIKNEITFHIKPKLQEKKNNIDAENPFPHLPILLRSTITAHICLPILEKVPMLQENRWQKLSLICPKLKHVYYSQDSYIIREGEPLDRMLLVVKGIVWKFASGNGGGCSTVSSRWESIEKGGYFGEEIINVLKFNGSRTTLINLSHLPICDKTLKTHTNVEAFVLMAKDLKDLGDVEVEPLTDSRAAQIIQKHCRRINNQGRGWKLRAKTG